MKNEDPARSVGFLIHEVARLMRHNFHRRVSALGLTQAQWRALVHLRLNEGINQASLAELIEVRPITLARLIDRLEAAGWVERRRDAADRRVSRLYLTEAAQPLLVEMEAAAGLTRQDALAGLSAPQRAQVVDLLCTLKQNLIRAAANAPATADTETRIRHE